MTFHNELYERHIERRVREALEDTPVVLVIGPRRSGKTTLARRMETMGRSYFTLDDQTTLDFARRDPAGFIRGLEGAIIDEVQRAPELLLAIKKSVDDDYRPGRYLLTGSANVMALPRVADSLAGRMETIRLLPLSVAERFGRRSEFLSSAFDGHISPPTNMVLGDDLISMVIQGGFPELLERKTEERQRAWARSYLESILKKDLVELANVKKMTVLPRFVRTLAHYSAELVNYSEVGSTIGLNYKTCQRYVGLLEQIFLLSTVQPWHSNTLSRVFKTPKLHFMDTALLVVSKGLTMSHFQQRRNLFGPVLESFVYTEICKQLGASEIAANVYHFRDYQKNEVDFVLERADGAILGIETKASATIRPSDLKGLKKLAESTRDRFAFGVLLYDGDTFIPHSENLAVVPLSCLW